MSEPNRIVICLDGTWQNPYKMRQRDDGGKVLKPTNVLKLSRAVLPRSPGDRRPQITYYDAGIGALVKYPGRANRFLSLADRLLGGVWGAGFEANIEEAFRFLAHNHEPGDEVFVFGFSRGAAQARALTHFLSWLGGVPEKGDVYFGPLFFLHWVKTRGTGRPDEVTTVDGRRPDHPMDPVDIKLLGVWDTVMALGSRLHTARGTSKNRWSFYVQPRPADCVRHARQALAVDENRFDFQPEIWSSCADDQTLIQHWFAGSHSNVGGGYVEDGLANIPFRWIVAEAESLGLAVDHSYVKHFNPHPQGRFYPSGSVATKTLEWARLRFNGGSRSMIGHSSEASLNLDRSVIHRMRANPAEHPQLDLYRPKQVIEYLRKIDDLDAFLTGIGIDPAEHPLPDDVLNAVRAH